VTGNPQFRWGATNDGMLYWGDGGGGQDTNLYRSAAGVLKTDGHFAVGGYLDVDKNGVGSQLRFGSAMDTNLYRSSAGVLKSDSHFHSMGHLLANEGGALQIAVGVDHGSGAAMISFHSSQDTNLYRSSAQTLQTDGAFAIGMGLYAGFSYPLGTQTVAVRASTDTASRFVIRNDGYLLWADGAAVPDSYIWRSGATALATNSNLTVEKAITSGIAAGQNNFAFYTYYSGAAGIQFLIRNQGKLEWGDAALDTNLYRASAGVLKTDGNILVGPYGMIIDGQNGHIKGVSNLDLRSNNDVYVSSQGDPGRVTLRNLEYGGAVTMQKDGRLDVAAAGIKFWDGSVQTKAGGTATRYYPIKLQNPRSTTLAGNSFWTVRQLTNYDNAHWEFVRDVEGRVSGQILIPASVAAVPNGKVVLVLNLAGVSRFSVLAALQGTDGSNMNTGFANLGSQDAAIPGAYGNKRISFPILPAGTATNFMMLIVEIVHEGNHANDTLAGNTWLVEAYLEIDS